MSDRNFVQPLAVLIIAHRPLLETLAIQQK